MIRKFYKNTFVTIFWLIMRVVFKSRHKYNYEGLQNIPKSGSVLLLGNHVSWIDWIILQLCTKRHINFMMDKDIYEWKYLNHMFKNGEVIPLSSKASKDAFLEAGERLKSGKVVALYPEGGISKDGELGKFYKGYEKIPLSYDGVIVPFYIDSGIFGSVFSKYKGKNSKQFFKRREVNIHFGTPVPKDTKAEKLKEIIIKLKEKHETK